MESSGDIRIVLRERVNSLLSISFRSPRLEYDNYTLEIDSGHESKFSSQSRKTVAPKFDINRKNISIFNYLQNTKDSNFILKLLDSSKNVILQFPIAVDELRCLTNSLSTEQIFCYPIVILEYSHGFFTTPAIFQKNEEIKEKINAMKMEKIKTESDNHTSVKDELAKNMSNNSSVINNTPQGNRKISFNDEKENLGQNAQTSSGELNIVDYSQYFLLMNQISTINMDNQRNKLFNEEANKNHVEKIQNLDYNLEKYIKQKRIEQMIKEKKKISEQNTILENIIEEVRVIIRNKQNHLHKFHDNLVIKNKENEERERNKKNYTKEYKKLKIIYNAFLNKKLIEVSYMFFQKEFYYLFSIPKISNDLTARYTLYSSHPKNFATYLGSTAMLFNYFSKIFGFCLRFPLFVSGSKSYCITKKKEGFNALYPDPKNENRHQALEIGIEYQKQNLKEIINFFSLHPDIFKPKEKFDYDSSFCEFYHRQNFFQVFEKFNNMLGHFISSFYDLNDDFGI